MFEFQTDTTGLPVAIIVLPLVLALVAILGAALVSLAGNDWE